MSIPKISDKAFVKFVKESNSIAQVIQKSGLIVAGGNYQSTKRRIKKLNLDISHFSGQSYRKNKTFLPKRDIKEYLIFNGPKITSHKLRIRLIKEGIKNYECEQCNNTIWNQKPISLELNHINGNHDDNRIENLEILCPNCHAQTDNYRGKNIKKNGGPTGNRTRNSSLQG